MPADPLSLILGGGQLLGGIVSGIVGGGQRSEAKRIMRSNIRPDYEIPQEAVQAAAEGLPSEQYSNAMKNIQRQQAAAISAAHDRRGGLEAIAKTQALTNSAVGDLDAANAAARMQNQKVLAQYREKAWDWNKRQKYEDTNNYAMSLMGAGNQNLIGGITKGIAGLGLGAYGMIGSGNKSGSEDAGGVYSPTASEYYNRQKF